MVPRAQSKFRECRRKRPLLTELGCFPEKGGGAGWHGSNTCPPGGLGVGAGWGGGGEAGTRKYGPPCGTLERGFLVIPSREIGKD